jgi:hypothetical protein
MSHCRLWYCLPCASERNYAHIPRYSRIRSRHASVPSPASTPEYAWPNESPIRSMLTVPSACCPSPIPRSSNTRSSFSPTPASKKSLYTAAHTENRSRTTSIVPNGSPIRLRSPNWSSSSRRHIPSAMRCEIWTAGVCSSATSCWCTEMWSAICRWSLPSLRIGRGGQRTRMPS